MVLVSVMSPMDLVTVAMALVSVTSSVLLVSCDTVPLSRDWRAILWSRSKASKVSFSSPGRGFTDTGTSGGYRGGANPAYAPPN